MRGDRAGGALARRHRLNALYWGLLGLQVMIGSLLPNSLRRWPIFVLVLVAFAAGTVNGRLWEGDERGW